jgi:hypothetical protein
MLLTENRRDMIRDRATIINHENSASNLESSRGIRGADARRSFATRKLLIRRGRIFVAELTLCATKQAASSVRCWKTS